MLAASQLPMVDPFDGGSDETMMLRQIQVRHRPRWLWLLPLGGAAAFPLFSGGGDWLDRALLAIPGLLLGHIAALFAGSFHPSCSIRLFIRKRTLKSRQLHDRVSLALFLMILPGALLFQLGPEWMHALPMVALPCWLISVLSATIRHRRLKCRIREGGFFEISGIHPAAIRQLSAIKSKVPP